MEHARRIILGITGGIAAYKMPALIRLLQKNCVEVTVVSTPGANGLVGEEALRVVSKNPAYCEDRPASHEMAHIKLAKWGQLLLVCPASANTIAKLSHGIADNLLTTLALSFEGRLIIAPAMNTAMWQNAATQRNIAVLQSRGATVLPVDKGELACGDEGPGRLLPIEAIADAVIAAFTPKILSGKKVLISSGPTAEPLDDVRVITNRSSGKMGAALARAALHAAAKVVVVSGPARVSPPPGCRVIPVTTALEMKAALEAEFDACDICIMAAAVSDYRPAHPIAGKKHRDNDTWSVDFTANPDIAEALGAKKSGQFLVGFSLEAGNDRRRSRKKMLSKKCDMMAVNDATTALETDTTAITVLFPEAPDRAIAKCDKQAAANELLAIIAERMKADR